MRIFFPLVIWLFTVYTGFSQERMLSLWSNEIPNQKQTDEKEIQNHTDVLRIENVQQPTLEVFLPTRKNATGKAMIICPGGGYHHLAYDLEGTDVAKWLNSKGIVAFVLKYRLPISKSIIVQDKAPLQDVQRAMRIVRYHAKQWSVDENQIGVMGFSAGGHLASTLSTHYNKKVYPNRDEIDLVSAKPNFMALVYPVISMDKTITHMGSRENLLSSNASSELISDYSNELQVTNTAPPTFIVHATDDKAVSVMNSILFYQALIKHNVDAEMHIYPKGGHGFSLAIGQGYLESWTDRLYQWVNGLELK